MKKPAKKPKKDAAQTALSVVEQAIGGKLADGMTDGRKSAAGRRKPKR